MSPESVPTRDEAPRVKLFMRSGNWVNLYDPLAQDIVLEDWVTGTSRAARWGGQTKGEIQYNVLQHSGLVEDILSKWFCPMRPSRPGSPRSAMICTKAGAWATLSRHTVGCSPAPALPR